MGERLAAVAKDRETMQKIAQEQARQEGGRNFKEIMVSVRVNMGRGGGRGGERKKLREDGWRGGGGEGEGKQRSEEKFWMGEEWEGTVKEVKEWERGRVHVLLEMGCLSL